MKTYTIKQKPSNTGSIYDIASSNYDRIIKFRKNCKYAVVLADYHGDSYTTHRYVKTTIKAAKRIYRDFIYAIIDYDGHPYYTDGYDLFDAINDRKVCE